MSTGNKQGQAYQDAEIVEINKIFKWWVLNLQDLLESKKRSARPKDLLDIQQLKEVNKME